MLRLAILFFAIALISVFFGFGLVAGLAFDMAKILFFVFLVLAVISLIGGLPRGRHMREL